MHHVALAAEGEADAELLHLALEEGRHHGPDAGCRRVQGRAQEGHRGLDGVGPGGLVGLAAGGKVGVGQHHLEGAAGQQRGDAGATLGAPLLQGQITAAVLFLPAEDGGALGHHHRAQQVAVVGQELGRFGQVVGLDVEVRVRRRGLAQVGGEIRRGAVALGQLIRAEQEVGEGQLDASGEHVGLEMHPQVGHHRGSDRRGRNAVAGPGHHRRGDQ